MQFSMSMAGPFLFDNKRKKNNCIDIIAELLSESEGSSIMFLLCKGIISNLT